jgi:hypothetical protein
MKTEEKEKSQTGEVGKATLEAVIKALAFVEKDGGTLDPLATPIIKALREAQAELETGIITVKQPAKDQAKVEYDDTNPENPRVLCNIPAGTGFWELADGRGKTPSWAIVVANPEKHEMALGCLAAATHAVCLFKDMQDVKRMRLSAGVSEQAERMALA